MKKALVVLIALAMVASLAACGTSTPVASSAAPASVAPSVAASTAPSVAASTAPSVAASVAPSASASASAKETIKGSMQYIAMISKGFQHPYWQQVQRGAQTAAVDENVRISFNGPASESDIQPQVDMLNAALADKPAALCLAALDTSSVNEQLKQCVTNKIPVIGFDSGVPNAPEGSIYSTAATDNEAAGGVGADQMFKVDAIQAAIKAATTDKPVVIACLNQDATSASITGRATGFVNEMVKNCEAVQSGKVAVTGHVKWAKAATSGKTAVEIYVGVAASSSVPDCQTNAQAALAKNPLGIFVSNSGSVDGLLAATSDGSDLDRSTGKYKNLIVVGFDSGSSELNAIQKKWFYGAITQDPYSIGYDAVTLALKAILGQTIPKVVDTGCHFYNNDNMKDPTIAPLLYQ